MTTVVIVRATVALGLFHSLPIHSDAGAYSQQAADMVHGKSAYPYFWPPGTSYFLAAGYWLLGVHAWVARVLMIFVSVLSVLTTTLLAHRLLRRWPAAALAGWTLALYPGMGMLAAEPYAQDLPLLAVTAALLFAVRAWDEGRLLDYGLLGLSLGVGSLARPSMAILAVAAAVAAICALLRRHRRAAPLGARRVLTGALLSAFVMLAVLSPAVVHNAEHHEGLTLATNSELDLWLGNNPYTPNYKTWDLGQRSASTFGPAAQSYLGRFAHPGTRTRAGRNAYFRETVRFVEAHPAVTVLRTINRSRAFWGFDYTMSSELRSAWHKGAAVEGIGLLCEVGGYALLTLLVLVGLVFARSLLRDGALALLVGVSAAFELPYALAYGAGRWHYPLLGVLAVFAGAGAYWLVGTPTRWRQLLRSRPLWIAAIVLLAVQIEYAYFATRGPIG